MANVLLGIHCVVSGCGRTLRKVNQWKTKPCSTHKGQAHSSCMCPEPYQFFKFPAEIKLQKIWLDRVRRPDLEINNLTRVCSLHFVEGKPTRRNYFPSINLRMKRSEAVKEEPMEMKEDKGEDNASGMQTTDDDERGKVSLVPMERLQEQPNDDDEELTVSSFHYPGEGSSDAREDCNSERGISRNAAVTITRVKPITNVHTIQSTNNPVSDGYQQVASNAPEVRRRVNAPTNRFIKFGSNQRPIVTLTPRPRPTTSIQPVSTIANSVRLLSTSVNTNQTQKYKAQPHINEEIDAESDNESVYSYMDMEDDGGDSSELSDIGIDIHPMRQQATPKSSASRSQLLQGKFVHQKKLQNIKPKVIPVFAVSPSTQQQQNGSFQPIITSVSTVSAMKTTNKPNTITGKETIEGSGHQGEMQNIVSSSPATVMKSIHKDDQDVEVLYSEIQPQPTPLATYDPTKQQLQIANPIKYIQECHTRIAQLLNEKQGLETTNNELEIKLRKLQEENNRLRREVVYQSTKALQRVRQTQQQQPQQQPTKPTPINLVPIRTLATPASRTTPESGTSPKRFRYVIKRPGNIFKTNKFIKK
ncbi:unnamed protein product [Orchesella dallaii]|uniref:THAP-type domain-containing protein n=1 Tax=Orchesella dallaii TaxID=48710 RepID=A0ABP1QG77_9HEXA